MKALSLLSVLLFFAFGVMGQTELPIHTTPGVEVEVLQPTPKMPRLALEAPRPCKEIIKEIRQKYQPLADASQHTFQFCFECTLDKDIICLFLKIKPSTPKATAQKFLKI